MLSAIPEKGRLAAAAFGACVLALVLLGARTVVRNRDWKDDLTLWTKTVQNAPQVSRARSALGNAYLSRALFDQAAEQFAAWVRQTTSADTRVPALGESVDL